MATLGDVVLIYCEEQPTFFARIEEILADNKPGWYQVRLLILQVPLREATWILREEYIDGEAFTMNGRSMRMEQIAGVGCVVPNGGESVGHAREEDTSGDENVISLFDRKRK